MLKILMCRCHKVLQSAGYCAHTFGFPPFYYYQVWTGVVKPSTALPSLIFGLSTCTCTSVLLSEWLQNVWYVDVRYMYVWQSIREWIKEAWIIGQAYLYLSKTSETAKVKEFLHCLFVSCTRMYGTHFLQSDQQVTRSKYHNIVPLVWSVFLHKQLQK